MSNSLHSLVASLPAIVIICGLIALFCIVLFDTSPTHEQRKTVKKFREPGKTEHDIHYVVVKPNAPPEDIEFDTGDLLVKVEEISPDSNVCLEVFPKEQSVPGSNAWQEQPMTDSQEDRSSDEQSCVLTFQYLQKTLWIFLETISDTSQKSGDVRTTITNENRKPK